MLNVYTIATSALHTHTILSDSMQSCMYGYHTAIVGYFEGEIMAFSNGKHFMNHHEYLVINSFSNISSVAKFITNHNRVEIPPW